jgi:ribosomal protein S18 acetylase RimI-like enzyme
MSSNYFIRPAEPGDLDILTGLLASEDCYQHRHLDWRIPVDWLGRQPFWILGKHNSAVAALSFPDDPPGVYWVRMFAAMNTLRLSQTWKLLFEKAISAFPPSQKPVITSLAVNHWYLELLLENGFSRLHDIVVLERNDKALPEFKEAQRFTIRNMKDADLQMVQFVDDAAFEGIWRNSLTMTTKAYQVSAYASVAELDGKIVGYQISTSNPFSAHLARIAVLPEMHRNGIGRGLIRDMLQFFTAIGINAITVNTQSDNHASIALYQKAGFALNGEKFPVLVYNWL